jgi:hypothetical protein
VTDRQLQEARESIARALCAARDRRLGDERDYDFRRELSVAGLLALDALVARVEQAEREAAKAWAAVKDEAKQTCVEIELREQAEAREAALREELADQATTIRNFPRIRAAMKVLLAQRGGQLRVTDDELLAADTGTVRTQYENGHHVFTFDPRHLPPALAAPSTAHSTSQEVVASGDAAPPAGETTDA